MAELSGYNTDVGNTSFESAASHCLHSNQHTPRSSKRARAYAKSYSLTSSPPLVPAIIVNHILAYIHKVNIRKKVDFVHMVCRYWSLKREARRGAPLLKRLHLEPWAGSGRGSGTNKGAVGAGSQEADDILEAKLDVSFATVLVLCTIVDPVCSSLFVFVPTSRQCGCLQSLHAREKRRS